MRKHTTPPGCTFDEKGKKVSDCNYCGCSTSQYYGQHSDYNGKCLHCGASTR